MYPKDITDEFLKGYTKITLDCYSSDELFEILFDALNLCAADYFKLYKKYLRFTKKDK